MTKAPSSGVSAAPAAPDQAPGPVQIYGIPGIPEVAPGDDLAGLISDAAGLPDVGPIAIDASLDGPRDGVATHVAASAGPLRAQVQGTLDLVHDAAAKQFGYPLSLYTYDTKNEHNAIAGLMRRLSSEGIEFKDLQTRQSSLEDIFVQLVKEQA